MTPIVDARSFGTVCDLLAAAAAAAANGGIRVRAHDGTVFTITSSRPAADPPQNPPMDLQIPLAYPFPCGWCEYDLRGQPLTGSCPECGTPVALTICQALEDRGHPLYPFLVSAFGPGKSMVSGYSPAAVAFVLGALNLADAEASARPGIRSAADRGIATAQDVLYGVRAQVQDEFGSEHKARAWLLANGLSTSTSFGWLTFTLARLGLARLSPSLTPRDFDGLFTLDSLFEI